jgi:hypothetical protein
MKRKHYHFDWEHPYIHVIGIKQRWWLSHLNLAGGAPGRSARGEEWQRISRSMGLKYYTKRNGQMLRSSNSRSKPCTTPLVAPTKINYIECIGGFFPIFWYILCILVIVLANWSARYWKTWTFWLAVSKPRHDLCPTMLVQRELSVSKQDQ